MAAYSRRHAVGTHGPEVREVMLGRVVSKTGAADWVGAASHLVSAVCARHESKKKRKAQSSATALSSAILCDGARCRPELFNFPPPTPPRKEREISHRCSVYDAYSGEKKGGDDQHKKLHNRFLTLFSCAGELSHRHHLTRAANLRGAGGAPPSSKPVPNRIEPLRTKAAKFGRKRNKKTTQNPWATPLPRLLGKRGLHFVGTPRQLKWKWGVGGPHVPSFGRDAPITQHRFPPSPPPPTAPHQGLFGHIF